MCVRPHTLRACFVAGDGRWSMVGPSNEAISHRTSCAKAQPRAVIYVPYTPAVRVPHPRLHPPPPTPPPTSNPTPTPTPDPNPNPQCAPLQARLRLLNDWADVQRKLPEKAVESSAGGRTSHLLRPCPTPVAPDLWPVASSKAGGVYGGRGERGGRGSGIRAGSGADVTCPSLLFVFQVICFFFNYFLYCVRMSVCVCFFSIVRGSYGARREGGRGVSHGDGRGGGGGGG